jgi:hypothetical protein
MRQNAVAPRPSQRNELISPRFQWAFFVYLGKGNNRVVAKYSRVEWCFRSERAFFWLDRKPVAVPNSEWDDSTVDRALRTIANDGDPASLY